MLVLKNYSYWECFNIEKLLARRKLERYYTALTVWSLKLLSKQLQASYPNTTSYPNTHYFFLAAGSKYPIRGSEEIMKKKLHGSSDSPVQSNLKYGCDVALADRICNYNRRFAEHAGALRNIHFDLFLFVFYIVCEYYFAIFSI